MCDFIEVNCFEINGINIIKAALLEGSKLATKECPFKIKLIKSPRYSISVKSNNHKKSTDIINFANDGKIGKMDIAGRKMVKSDRVIHSFRI